MSFLSAQKKAALKWANDRLWHRWPMLMWPIIKGFRKNHSYFPNLLRPHTLNEKVVYRMLFDRRTFLPLFAGKLESRGFVTERLGNSDALIPLAGVISNASDVEHINFPSRFIMKAAHGSGMNYLHDTDTPPDLDHLKTLCSTWLNHDFGKYNQEWCYKNVQRAVIVQEIIRDLQGEIPRDYKFFCYDGVPLFVKVDSDRFTFETSDIFDCEWNHIPGHSETPASAVLPPRPPNLQAMVDMAAKLSRGVDFVRVDLYDTGRDVKFGELTMTPARGLYLFNTKALDDKFGAPWKLSLTKNSTTRHRCFNPLRSHLFSNRRSIIRQLPMLFRGALHRNIREQ